MSEEKKLECSGLANCYTLPWLLHIFIALLLFLVLSSVWIWTSSISFFIHKPLLCSTSLFTSASPRLASSPPKLTFLKQLHLWDMTGESFKKARHRPFTPRWLPYYFSVQTASWYLNFEFSTAIFLLSFQDSRHTNEWYRQETLLIDST